MKKFIEYSNLMMQRIREYGILGFLKRLKKFFLYKYIFWKRLLKFRYLRLRTRDRFLLKNIQGSKMYLDLLDEGISLDLALDGIRETESTEMIKKFVRKEDVVIDIGTNIGYYLLMESRLVGKTGKVYGIEPVPHNIKILKMNTNANKCPNVEIFQGAVGDKNGTVKMYISSKSNLHSIIYSEKKEIIDSVDVQVFTLDEFIKNKRRPNFIRMDVEGYEYQIIIGMKNLLKSGHPLKLFIELHPHLMGKEKMTFLLNVLKKNGFKIKKTITHWPYFLQFVKGKPPNFSFKNINEMLQDKLILSGERGGFEMFFERN